MYPSPTPPPWRRSTVAAACGVALLVTTGFTVTNAPVAGAASPDVLLSEVYGGGGNSGATYTHDFVELHNRGTGSVSLSGWSVQYASASGTTWSATALSGTIAPGSKYLVRLASGGGTGSALPTPEATGTTNMSASSGKVALVTSTGALSCGSNCDTASGVRDFLGYGSANDAETSPAPTLSNTTSATRTDPSTDTDDNSSNFTAAAPTPQNASTGGGSTAPACSTAGTWTAGELTTYWFDVEQGDSQLIVGPTGKTLLIDLGETAWNSTGTNTKASMVAQRIREICGISSGPVHLDYVMASHHHLDHIGYAANPNDTSTVGNGIYQLLTPPSVGGLGFTVGQVLDHDGGVWTDTNGDSDCDVGTSSAPANETAWHNAGTTSQTARRWMCWLYGPASQPDRAIIDGKVTRLTNSGTWPALDLGTGVTATIVMANAKNVMQADGVTPVSGNHTSAAVPPSENDYSIGLRVAFGPYVYATAGDSDGEYDTSSYGYTYNDIEAHLVGKFGTVAAARANHHGSGHSSANSYLTGLSPQVGVISCGANSYGHPANRVLDAFRSVSADIYLTNRPCDTTDASGAAIDYTGTFNQNGTVTLVTTGAGAGFRVTYDTGTRTYTVG